MTLVPWSHLGRFFAACAQAVDEAVLNALFVDGDMIGRDGNRVPRMPVDRVLRLLRDDR
ncbi:hypothetical protein QEZ54_21025 [Catellatospora sp. KI3]|uniref:hypothetical protein n=1 Tax=Catellatospora sp. KI3 TaxID=3041620 RepID=UPI002482C53B|nr:hypothetical protein [Catellatospora sp. KI3]MDI1463469.1 hypothetical protein [Catellatospora sp. KI3]